MGQENSCWLSLFAFSPFRLFALFYYTIFSMCPIFWHLVLR